MHGQLVRRGARVAAVATLAFVTTINAAGATVANSPDGTPVEVALNASGIQAPDSHQAGLVSFRVKTDDSNGRQLQLLRPNKGVSLERVLHDLARAVSNNPRTAAAGIRTVGGEAEALGGALVTRQVHEQFTEEISAGTVYLLDFTAFLAQPTKPVVKSINLSAAASSGQNANLARYPHGIVIQRETSARPRFETEDVDNPHLAYLVHNDSSELHEMQLRPVKVGTTDKQIQEFFDAIKRGKQSPPSPFTGPPTGLGALSPDHSALIQAHGLQPGTYVLLCFIPDDHVGVPHAFLGMHKIVKLH
ncbi:hypothetical protein ABIA33_004844 [Streptacidiphilus sp. MAP12-16]|uniref:hypothetical protein n=1 Tax=Streptacidiphilus sp. MAP12-16 TaxID=3156300 RepID=UPI0035149A7C